MRESSINVKSVEKSSLKWGPWELTKELPMRVCSSVVNCSHKEKRKGELLAHEAFIHLKGNAIKCNICDKRFLRKSHLKIHMQSHIGADKPHVCSTCPKRFGTNWERKRHEETHNKLRNPTHKKINVEMCECGVCGKKLRGRRGLNAHMEIHKNEQRYKCSFCQLRFNTNSKMRYHERDKRKRQHKPESISPLEKLDTWGPC